MYQKRAAMQEPSHIFYNYSISPSSPKSATQAAMS